MTGDNISRVLRSKESARASYDRMSRWYDRISGNTEKKYQEWGLRVLETAEGEKILDIGCGTGNSLICLARNTGATGRVIGVDISRGMLAVAKRRIDHASQSSQIELCQGDGTQLSFASNSFDAIFISFALELFDTPEIPVVLSECLRVVEIGGRICIVALSKVNGGLPTDFYEWFHRIMPNIVDCRPIFLSKVMQESGFHITKESRTFMWGLPVEVVLAKKIHLKR